MAEPNPTEPLARRVVVLSGAVRLWHGEVPASRGTQRGAATVAVDEIDGMLAELHRMRERLIGEARTFDGETMRRADELSARIASESREHAMARGAEGTAP